MLQGFFYACLPAFRWIGIMIFEVMRSWILVVVQFACLGYYALSGAVVVSTFWLLMMELTGIGIGVWAVATVRVGRVSVFPEPRSDAELVTTGPFRWIRHPMYTGLLLIALSITLERLTWLDGTVFVLLLLNQLAKVNYEEQGLNDRFPEYRSYSSRTKKLIPWVF